MAKALLGYLPSTADRRLIEENARLKGRIHELEGQLDELRAAVESERLLHELHRIATSESALA